MSRVIQDRYRYQIRQSIGRAIGVIVGEATSTVDTTSLIDTVNLLGADDEHNGKQVIIYDATGSIVDGEIQRVTDFAGSSNDATTTAFTASITDGDKFEMWPYSIRISDVNDIINRAIIDASQEGLQPKQTTGNFTLSNIYEYAWLSGFEGVYMVEYVNNIGIEHDIHMCEAAWDELVDGDVTAALDTSFNVEGSGCLKLTVAAGCDANDILATDSIDSLDISDCDQVEVWIRSSVALDAGDLQLLLDNTAQCASAVESLDIPATLANTGTHHVISLANPESDTAIISVGVKMVTDKGAFTLYVDRIKAVKSTSREYRELNPKYFELVKGSTNYLKLTTAGKSVAGDNNNLRISGYALPSLMTADTDVCELDPEYVVSWSLAHLLLYHAPARNLDVHNREKLGEKHLLIAERKKMAMSINFDMDVRML